MDITEIKALSREQIKGKIGKLFLIGIILFVLSMASGYIEELVPFLGGMIYEVFIISPLALGLVNIYLNISNGMDIEISTLFSGYQCFWGAFKVRFLSGLYVMLWSLLFLIPGIIKYYAYSMAMYVFAENPEMGALGAISESEDLMDGHKLELFVLQLSFIGWFLLSVVTLGIGFIWVSPYYETAVANFYKKLKQEKESIGYVNAVPADVEAENTEE